MKRNKGQALIEFIIILPVLALLIASMVDIFNIMKNTYNLENDLSTIVTLYSNHDTDNIESLTRENKIDIKYEYIGNTTKIYLNKNIRVATPILKNILGNPYTITVNRVVYNNEEE